MSHRFEYIRLLLPLLTPLLFAPIPTARTASATETLPIIVTYEMKRQSEAERVELRNPKAFWIRQIVARIEDKKPASLGLKEPATALILFTVARDGHIVSRSLERSSGVPSVDDAAVLMLRQAQPFPPMPEALKEDRLSFSLPLRFR